VTWRRYALPEIVGTLAAVGIAWLVHRTGTVAGAAWAASLAETAGYYGTVMWRDRRLHRSLRAQIPGLLVEFGPAEVLDTVLLRPALMWAVPLAIGHVTAGVLIGKLAADVLFYSVAVPCRALRLRLFPLPATPYLDVDLDAVEGAYRQFETHLGEVRVHYAVKCNPDRAVLRRLRRAGSGFEIASAGELRQLRRIGVPAADVLFSNPVKDPAHIRTAHRAGVWRFAADSAGELAKIAEHAPGAAVYLRVATVAGAGLVGSEGKFGVPPPDATRLLREARERGLRPYGLTFHVGSQMVDPTAWPVAIDACRRIMTDLRDDGITLTMLDLGGGFPVRYDADPPELSEIAKHIRNAVALLPYPVQLVAEPGRALVADAGTMVTTVIGIAERSGATWVHLDVGAFNGLMEALESGNTLRYPVSDSRPPDGPRARYHLTGPTCDSQDTILYDVLLSAGLAVGDTVRIHVAGAYTSAYASAFNGFAVPGVRVSRSSRSGRSC
jgi:ornithine decarboxylase